MIPYSKMQKLLLVGSFGLIMQSCSYSVIVSSQKGLPESSPLNTELGFYNGKKVTVVDTVVRLSLVQNGVGYVAPGLPAGFHSVEYKVTFGEILRNTFTFGKRKTIKVKYVRLKETN
jgi:hypothetical protein